MNQGPPGPKTLFFILRPVDPGLSSCKHPSAHKPYFSYHVPSTQLHSHASTLRPTNLIFHANFSSACHVPSTHVRSHASILRPTNLIFHTTSRRPRFTLMQLSFGPQTLFFMPIFRAHATSRRLTFILMQVFFGPQTLFFIPRPVDPGLLLCNCPSAHKLYFSSHFFECMLRPVNPCSFSCKYPSAHKPYFHTNFSSACHVSSIQVHSYASVH